MWDKPDSLRQLANILLGVSLVLALYGALHYVLRMPEFPLRAVQLSAAPNKVDVAQIETVVRNEVRGNFFTVNMESTRHAFEKLPWVRKVSVRRHFPWRLEVAMEEHVALARWNGTGLVNTHGEVFVAGSEDQVLPRFIGQPDTAAEVTQMYGAFCEQLAPIKQGIAQLSLSPRHAWQLRLSSGMVLELGREQPQQRLARFVTIYPHSLASMQHKVNYVDLRYQNGFAAHLPGYVVEKKKQS